VDTIRERFVFAAPLAAANDDELAALVERHLAADDVQVLPAIEELIDRPRSTQGCALRASALADRLRAGNERRRPAMNLLWGKTVALGAAYQPADSASRRTPTRTHILPQLNG
jgi:hypothetical protein